MSVDKSCKFCASDTDTIAWVCVSFEIRAGGAGICVGGDECGGVHDCGWDSNEER